MNAPPKLTAAAFRLSLAQAAAWCDPRVDNDSPETCLRSSELQAALPKSELSDGYRQMFDIVNRLVELRASFVTPSTALESPRGRLLCCDISSSEASEASYYATRGFFDAFDVPPWDSWVAWFSYANATQPDNGYLLAFVPSVFVELAQRGLHVNPVDCIFWADDLADNGRSQNRFFDLTPSWYRDEVAAFARRTKLCR